MKSKIISRCLNCGKDTGCPNKLVCEECKKKNISKGVFYKNYIKKDLYAGRFMIREKVK
ncbi:MAG: hypothetical protein AB1349_12480 [Elusimicrobiota bacterium]